MGMTWLIKVQRVASSLAVFAFAFAIFRSVNWQDLIR
jgi:hypothetical protein